MYKATKAIILTLALATLLFSSAFAGKLYQLEFCWFGDIPDYPANIVLNVYDGYDIDPGKLKGTSSMDLFFDNGWQNENFMFDNVAFLTSGWEVDGMLRICFAANGFDNGKFKASSSFEIVVNGVSSYFNLHTSCSQEILIGEPYMGTPGGYFVINGGTGTCVPGNPDCPEGDKLYELTGCFERELEGCTPSMITFNVYKKSSELKGTATAMWTGAGLTDIVCDNVACITDARMEGDRLVVCWEAFGYKDNGEFDADSSFEIDLGNCGSCKLNKQHTSCSRPIYLYRPVTEANDTDSGSGGSPTDMLDCEVYFTGGCGACLVDQPVPTGKASWGAIKSMY